MSEKSINKRIAIISDLQKEAKKIKETYDEMYNDNPVVQRLQSIQETFKKEMDEYTEKINAVKEQGVIKNCIEELKDIKLQIKENKELLSQDLADYYRENGSLEFVDENGSVQRIKFSAKLTSN